MPLNPALLKTELKAELIALSGSASDATIQADAFDPIAEAIANKVIAHIQANGLVTVNPLGLVAPSGPVTGTATGTIS
jgi:hypothetical protein